MFRVLASRIKSKLLGGFKRKLMSVFVGYKHGKLLKEVRGKAKVKVVFFVIHKSLWKVDSVFLRMMDDDFFEPVILVCPYVKHDEERMWQDLFDSVEYFKGKGYPVICSYNQGNNSWIRLDEIKPDVVFFTNPHALTRKEYFSDAYMNYLSCYVPYYTDVASNYGLQQAYNGVFHNVIWKHFVESEYVKKRVESVLSSSGRNLIVTGSPMLEEFLNEKQADVALWKTQGKLKKKIIYAPHQSIFKDGEIKLSTFLEVGEVIRQLAVKYKDEIQWSFKPHPLLKGNLYQHPDWGKKKTDEYYLFWSESDFCQIDNGEYIDLFKSSDAIVHDCGSFIVDYLFTGHKCAYLELNSDDQLKAINEFGLRALDCYTRIRAVEQVEGFLKEILCGDCSIENSYADFMDEYVYPYRNKMPSLKIVENIKMELL